MSEVAGSKDEGLTRGVEAEAEYALDRVDGIREVEGADRNTEEAEMVGDRLRCDDIAGTNTGIAVRLTLEHFKLCWKTMEGFDISPDLFKPLC